jgi:glycine/D-amino acid oxidase-like deaminating enzyme
MDLHSGAPYWLLTDGLGLVVPPLDRDEACDVAVIGAGITGAFVADEMARRGLSVVVLDGRDVGQGSTLASTALLQYDIDVPLRRLRTMVGRDNADRAYCLGVEAIDRIQAHCGELGCPFTRCGSVHFTTNEGSIDELYHEWRARREIGLDAEWLCREELASGMGMCAAGAISTSRAGETDPYRLCQALLRRAMAAGSLVHDRTRVTEIEEREGDVVLTTHRGPRVQARFAIHATGYEFVESSAGELVELGSTYALVSEPIREAGRAWSCRSAIWEFAQPYFYGRWCDGRVLIGGEDEPISDESTRDALLSAKTEALSSRLSSLFPDLDAEPAFAWSGTFASTRDGLGFIGPRTKGSRQLFALGFGGNGTTCGAIAARILSHHVCGVHDPDATVFRFGR